MIEYQFVLSDENYEPLMAELEALSFEGFWEDGNVLKGYVEQAPEPEAFQKILQRYRVEKSTNSPMLETNWNAVWESNYSPATFGDRLFIHGDHHQPSENHQLNIQIDPRMAFGTGHHETTSLIIEALLELEEMPKSVLDNGCGSGVLAILAAKQGAQRVVAIDNDPNAVENARHNCTVNDTKGVKVLEGTVNDVQEEPFELVLSNITRNINMELLPILSTLIQFNGRLWLSGFYHDDVESVRSHATAVGLTCSILKQKNGWVLVELKL
jgi:ribosomal protein L11 methyltransferase